jgi:TM2 domain-containing membrane protein YozV
MTPRHTNKTIATFLSSVFGSIGLHRFYVHGRKDRWAWVHLLTLPLSGIALLLFPTQPALFTLSPLLISGLVSLIEALVIGLTPDDKWDAKFNSGSGQVSQSDWPLALLLVLTLGAGAIAVIATIARFFDLLFTGGAYG